MVPNQPIPETQAKANLRKEARRNNMVIFGFAILMSILLTLLYYQLRQPPANVEILFAATQLQAGEKILPNSVAWTPILPSQIKPGMIMNKALGEQIIGSEVKLAMYPGQPITLEDVNLIAGGITARLLDAGSYAVSVALPSNQSIKSLITPGDKINILLLWKNDKQNYAEFILQNIKVMSIATDTQMINKDDVNSKKGNTQPKIMVLQMTAKELKKYSLASKLGDITYVVNSAYSFSKEDKSGILFGSEHNSNFNSIEQVRQLDTFRGTKKTVEVLP
ncbi:MAG: Flp pilus assembly protein CpaB [Legionella sp.]|jgi:Flp pilus assembly protein CpaB